MSDLLDDQHLKEMAGSYEFYRDFHSVERARAFASLLKDNRIPYRLEKTQTLLDAAIVGHGLMPPFLIKIRSSDFKKVNYLLEEAALKDPEHIEGHYLQQLDDKELIGIMRQPTDWTVEDAAVARRILNNRGIPIPKEHVELFNRENNEELHKGKKGSLGWLVFYLLCIFFGSVMVSPFFLLGGFGMGWYYWQDKTVDNQGVKYFSFEENTRIYGKLIFYFGCVCVFFGGVAVFYLNFF